jgi:hypothetical protein
VIAAALPVVETLPDIPRALTGLAEWLACLVYVLLRRQRLPRRRLVPVAVVALGVQIGVQELADQLPIQLWTLGMAAAVAAMYAFIITAAKVSARDAGYFAARALVLAELVAALHWQVHCFFFLPEGRPGIEWQGPFFVLVYAIFYIRTLVDLCGFVALYAQQGQRLQHRARSEVRAIDEMLRRQHAQYLQSKRSIEIVNRKYHDLKHQIGVIRAEGDPRRRASYLDDLEASVSGYAAQADTGNGVLDVILTTKSQECAERGIDLTYVVDGAAVDFMSAMDVSAVFGNALDNAMDGVLAVPDPERRLIKVALYARDRFVLLTFENYFTGELRTEDGDIVTRRSDRTRHGYGLKSIRYTAEKYGGSMTVNVEDDWFVLRILLPIPQDRAAGPRVPAERAR